MFVCLFYDPSNPSDGTNQQEFDTPATLFAKQDGIFRGMCERSSITMEDIRLADKVVANQRDEDEIEEKSGDA